MISTNRQLIKHGPVSVTSLNKSQFTYFLLFSDVAVFASPSAKSAKKLDMKEIIQLEQVALRMPHFTRTEWLMIFFPATLGVGGCDEGHVERRAHLAAQRTGQHVPCCVGQQRR
jgi:hypothetical protein